MSVTIPSLSDVTDILDTDMVMVTQSGGQTYKISGADLNKRNQAVIANSTTLTGAPLKTGNIVRVHFTADITGVNTTTALSLSYNGTSKTVKVPKDGALANFTAQNMGGSPTVYKYLQAYTTLELLYDGTNFVIIGNPVVISSSDYTIYADGSNKGLIEVRDISNRLIPDINITVNYAKAIIVDKIVIIRLYITSTATLNSPYAFPVFSSVNLPEPKDYSGQILFIGTGHCGFIQNGASIYQSVFFGYNYNSKAINLYLNNPAITIPANTDFRGEIVYIRK